MSDPLDPKSTFTAQQEAAVRSDGNVLVMAGAGTGKTRTLVERCVQQVLRGEASLDEILMVTFTEAAAGEMRKRIRERLEQAWDQLPNNPLVTEQLALLENASISTLHGFCYQLVRQHFYELDLDPQVKILTPQQARVLQEETFDEIFHDVYAGGHPQSDPVRELIKVLGQGRDKTIRTLVRQVHEHTQTRPDPASWFARETARLAQANPKQLRGSLFEAVRALCQTWGPLIEANAPDCENLADCAERLRELRQCDSEKQLHAALERIREIAEGGWKKEKGKYHGPLKGFFEDALFLHTVANVETGNPLLEDWQWSAPHLLTLVKLAGDFAQRFEAAKQAMGGIDFHDLEQKSLRLLYGDGQITELAREWQQRFKFVFVDEYQDINPAQDQILRALSRGGAEANRFLVGDVKQSIYRFRQADPGIFQRYAIEWKEGKALTDVLLLSENFRTREIILDFINGFFGSAMSPDFGGSDYKADGTLVFGNRTRREHLSKTHDSQPRTEIHLILKARGGDDDEDRTTAEREARAVALRLKELQERQTQIWDEPSNAFRPVQWKDMAVLLRASHNKIEAYAKEFDKAGVPLLAVGTALFESLEVHDLVNLLMLLDNPLQDQPLLAVLRSPLAGLSPEELGKIRLAVRKAPYWTTLEQWHKANKDKADDKTFAKVDTFLDRFRKWRSAARCASLTQRLEQILEETHYLDWLATQSRADQRQANVRQLLRLAREFDTLRRESLYRFLQFLEAEKDAPGDQEQAPADTVDAVRVMTIHKSKGLEFPVVAVPDLGKKFNTRDISGEILLDADLGTTGKVHPPGTMQSYPSLPFWLAKKKHHAAMLSEELRLLYVAMTRARDLLVLSATCTEKKAQSWTANGNYFPTPARLARAQNCLDWLGPWLASDAPRQDWLEMPQGAAPSWTWRISRIIEDTQSDPLAEPAEDVFVSLSTIEALKSRLEWNYPYGEATLQVAKTSASALRREAAEELEVATPFVHAASKVFVPFGQGEPTGADIGVAHHLFLQSLDLARVTQGGGLEDEAKRLVTAGIISSQQAEVLDLPGLARFWTSDLGQKIAKNQNAVQREVAFTVRLTGSSDPSIPLLSRIPENEFIVMQGAVDLAVFLPNEIWIIDFKTDQVTGQALRQRAEEYSTQIKLYALALSQIYRKPVTQRWLHFLKSGESVSVP